MAPLRTFAALSLCVGASAFAPSKSFVPSSVASRPTTSLNVFNDAMKEFETDYPKFAEMGWGPSVQAEKWNGRHAMFGWVVLCATAYAKGHGLIPNADVPLDLKEWGTLATISGKTTLTNERAIILIANVHAFFVGLCATICPLPFGDPLLLDPNAGEKFERAAAKEPYGVVPAFKPGLTDEAEMFNGRLAMLGLVCLAFTSLLNDKPMLDVVNEWVGGAYY